MSDKNVEVIKMEEILISNVDTRILDIKREKTFDKHGTSNMIYYYMQI